MNFFLSKLAEGFDMPRGGIDLGRLLGGHADCRAPVTGPVKEALEDAMKALKGSGIWRSRGLGLDLAYPALVMAKDEAILKWKKATAPA